MRQLKARLPCASCGQFNHWKDDPECPDYEKNHKGGGGHSSNRKGKRFKRKGKKRVRRRKHRKKKVECAAAGVYMNTNARVARLWKKKKVPCRFCGRCGNLETCCPIARANERDRKARSCSVSEPTEPSSDSEDQNHAPTSDPYFPTRKADDKMVTAKQAPIPHVVALPDTACAKTC